jgi:hypothetical protein
MRVVVRLGYSIELRSSPIVIKMNYDANERVAFGNELKSTSPRLVYHYGPDLSLRCHRESLSQIGINARISAADVSL